MKSLQAWVLLCVTGTLLLSLLVFLGISTHVLRAYLDPVFESMDELELEDALQALHTGGAPGAAAYMGHLDRLFVARHYLLGRDGHDVVTGSNLRKWLPQNSSVRKSRGYVEGHLVVTHESADARYWFVAVDPGQSNFWTFFPYYLLVIGVTGTLYWLAAAGVLWPIQRIAGALERFGRGDLSVRVNVTRRDEIGRLARSFDEMAARIETLLASERRLLTDISHELRSPLTRLMFAVKLAGNNTAGEGPFDRVQREVDRITALVSEITELTRAEGDAPGRKLEPVELRRVVEETVHDCEIEAQYRRCRIEMRGHLAGVVNGDRELLRRAVENVLRNAIRYSPEQAAIECDLKEEDGAAIIAVRDYGLGVPAEMLAQIFEPFFRVEESRNPEMGGVGLGLAIAKRAIEVHRGSLFAENASPGLRVTITIPVSKTATLPGHGGSIETCP